MLNLKVKDLVIIFDIKAELPARKSWFYIEDEGDFIFQILFESINIYRFN